MHLLASDECDEDAAKTSAAEAVNDEIERRIGDDQQITDSHVVEVRERAVERLFGQDGRQSLRDKSRALTEDEDQYNDD